MDYQSFNNFCGDVRIFHDFPGEIRKNTTTSTGELKPGRLHMEKQELESSLSGNNSVGRVFILPGKSGAWVVCQSTGELS